MKIGLVTLLLMTSYLAYSQPPTWLLGCWEQRKRVDGEKHLLKIEFSKDSSVVQTSFSESPLRSGSMTGKIISFESGKFLINYQGWRLNDVDFSSTVAEYSEWTSVSRKGAKRIRIRIDSKNEFTGQIYEDILILRRCR
jgi:hypothetical protein